MATLMPGPLARWQPAYWATVIGVATVASGFALLLLGWRGTAGLLDIAAQLPYSASGGLTGLALIGFGTALVNVQVTRHLAAREHVLTRQAMYHINRLLLEHATTVLHAPPEAGR